MDWLFKSIETIKNEVLTHRTRLHKNNLIVLADNLIFILYKPDSTLKWSDFSKLLIKHFYL